MKRWLAASDTATPTSSTFLYYDGWNLIQEGPNSSAADRIYAHGNRVDEVVADQYGGAWAYHHYDARGHCILLTDASGNIVEQYDYDAFGKPYFYNASGTLLTSSGWGNRFLFSGSESSLPGGAEMDCIGRMVMRPRERERTSQWLNNIAVYDFRNRHYLPELGRFIQPDPKEFDAGDYNLYRYCHNDPVNHTDPEGELMDGLAARIRAAKRDAEQAQQRYAREGTAIDRAKALPGASDRADDKRQPGDLRITKYGYRGDNVKGDPNTPKGLGVGNRILTPNSVALSRDHANKFHLDKGIYVNDHYIGNYKDTTSPASVRTIDVYDPSGRGEWRVFYAAWHDGY